MEMYFDMIIVRAI